MKLTREDILRLLTELNLELKKDAVTGELYLMGGAVMCLALRARPATQDRDCMFEPSAVIREKAQLLAKKRNLPHDWLNDGVKGFLSSQASFEPFLDLSHLKILVCTPAYLLSMKCLAMRLGEEFHDEDDVRFLLRYLNIESYERALTVLGDYYPVERYPQKTFSVLQELLCG